MTGWRRAALVAATASLAAGIPAARAQAAQWAPCAELGGWTCTDVVVPLDRTDRLPGTLRLRVARHGARFPRRAPLVVLAGGPGQASLPLARDIAELARPGLADRELLLFDSRGTGASGALRCELQSAPSERLAAAGAACARRLGPGRDAYTSWDTAQDLEAVRAAVGAARLAVLGISYGARVALAYATLHPWRVERLVLDSPVSRMGPDPLLRPTLAALPRVLWARCGGCSRLLPTILRRSAWTSPARRAALLQAIVATDVDQTLAGALPAALRAAARGRPRRLLALQRAAAEPSADAPEVDSAALNAATLCSELAFPWGTLAPGGRRARLIEAVRPSAAAPFGRDALTFADAVRQCLRWPAPARHPPALPARRIGAPALVLAGELDLRTPLEALPGVVAPLAHRRVVRLPVGHSVLGTDRSGRAGRELATFLGRARR